MAHHPNIRERGFTLVEVAIVMLIGGILLATASTMLLSYLKKTEINTTQERLDQIDEALQLFLSLNGRYPCPARLNAAPDTANFGVEISENGCNTVAPAADETIAAGGGRGGRLVRIGAVPVRTLNLPDDFVRDAWGGRFTYAITESLAHPTTYNRDEGAIFVNDAAGNPVVTFPAAGTAHYIINSHGENNAGAYSASGTGRFACTAGTRETENCDDDATFVSTTIRSTGNNANLYDDFIRIRATTALGIGIPDGAVMAFDLSACPDGWVPFANANGRMIVGADGATYNRGNTGGAETVTLSLSTVGAVARTTDLSTLGTSGTTLMESTGAATAHNNMPPYLALLYCRKS